MGEKLPRALTVVPPPDWRDPKAWSYEIEFYVVRERGGRRPQFLGAWKAGQDHDAVILRDLEFDPIPGFDVTLECGSIEEHDDYDRIEGKKDSFVFTWRVHGFPPEEAVAQVAEGIANCIDRGRVVDYAFVREQDPYDTEWFELGWFILQPSYGRINVLYSGDTPGIQRWEQEIRALDPGREEIP